MIAFTYSTLINPNICFERVNEPLNNNALLQSNLPITIPVLLMRVRMAIVASFVSRQYNNDPQAKTLAIRLANQLGFGIPVTDVGDDQLNYGDDFKEKMTSYLKLYIERGFRPFYIVYELANQIKIDLSHYGYKKEDASKDHGYNDIECKSFILYLGNLLPEYVNYSFLITDKNNKVTDLNWFQIKKLLWQRLVSGNFFLHDESLIEKLFTADDAIKPLFNDEYDLLGCLKYFKELDANAINKIISIYMQKKIDAGIYRPVDNIDNNPLAQSGTNSLQSKSLDAEMELFVQYISWNIHEESATIFLDFLKTHYSPDIKKFMADFLLKKNTISIKMIPIYLNVFKNIDSHADYNMVQKIAESLANTIQITDKYTYSILKTVSEYRSWDLINLFLSYRNKNTDENLIMSLLKKSELDNIKQVIFLLRTLTRKEQAAILKQRNKTGETILTCSNLSEEIFNEFCLILIQLLPEDFMEIMQQFNRNNYNILMLAATSYPNQLEVLLKNLKRGYRDNQDCVFELFTRKGYKVDNLAGGNLFSLAFHTNHQFIIPLLDFVKDFSYYGKLKLLGLVDNSPDPRILDNRTTICFDEDRTGSRGQGRLNCQQPLSEFSIEDDNLLMIIINLYSSQIAVDENFIKILNEILSVIDTLSIEDIAQLFKQKNRNDETVYDLALRQVLLIKNTVLKFVLNRVLDAVIKTINNTSTKNTLFLEKTKLMDQVDTGNQLALKKSFENFASLANQGRPRYSLRINKPQKTTKDLFSALDLFGEKWSNLITGGYESASAIAEKINSDRDQNVIILQDSKRIRK